MIIPCEHPVSKGQEGARASSGESGDDGFSRTPTHIVGSEVRILATCPFLNLMPENEPSETQIVPSQTPRSLTKRWKHEELFDLGFVAVPTLFLRHYAHLKPKRLTIGEAMFVLHLMEFKWDADAPFPGYATLAKRMGISDKMTRRHAQSLEAKKYLKRELRVGLTNRFDLSPLFDALLKAVHDERDASGRVSRKISPSADSLSWQERMIDALATLSAREQYQLRTWKSGGAGRTVADWPRWEALLGKRPE